MEGMKLAEIERLNGDGTNTATWWKKIAMNYRDGMVAKGEEIERLESNLKIGRENQEVLHEELVKAMSIVEAARAILKPVILFDHSDARRANLIRALAALDNK